MKIAILGYGIEGQAAYDYWREGNEITVCDRNESISLPVGVYSQLGEGYLYGLDKFDVIVRSPQVHPRDIAAANTDSVLGKVTSNTNEFFRVSPTRNIIGVTGTKGKGTTSTLLTKLLEASGNRVHLGGNIGVAALDLLKDDIQPDDWVVLELSSYQLADLKYSPHLAVCLLIEPEHLDWHGHVDDYHEAKSQLFAHQTSDDVAVYFAENEVSRQIASSGQGRQIPYFAPPGAHIEGDAVVIDDQKVIFTDELKLPGKHNWENVCAALTVFWQISQNAETAHEVLTNFAGLPYRIEFRAEKNDIRYYNDSFSSVTAATRAAVEAIPGKQVLIVGGYDRGLPMEHFVHFIQEHAGSIRKLLVIGASGDRVIEALKSVGFDNYQRSAAKNMPDIVYAARDLAEPGDAVVLSPGFPSYDMFKNFEDRGQQFNAAVEAL